MVMVNNKTNLNKKAVETQDDRKASVSKLNGHFSVISQIDVPHGRNGKHKDIITRILSDLSKLKDGNAMRIRLSELPDTKEKIRAALSRAVHIKGIEIVTSTDDDHLYIWKAQNK
jgi:hypothetical protein